MTLKEALDACKPSADGDVAAVTFPQRQLIAVRIGGMKHGDWVVVFRIGDENTDGTTRPGGEWIEGGGIAGVAYQWRPAVV